MKIRAGNPARHQSAFSEDRLVRVLRDAFGKLGKTVRKGIGDDAAVLSPPGADEYWLVTTDMLVEDIDFRRGWQTPEQLGARALAVNISDIAAMGARPRHYTVALGVPGGIGERWIREFYRGLSSAGTAHRAVLVGGDFSRTPSGIIISIAVIGETLHRKVLYRSGGRSGDILYVTGVLGKAAAGLALLECGMTRNGTAAQRSAIVAHRAPVPRCDAGLWLAHCGAAGAMMDLSDGLSMDLPRLCEASSCGAEIELSGLPVFQDSEAWGCDPAELALIGAEDYELLFSIRPDKVARFEAAYPASLPPVSRIGKLTRGRKIVPVAAPGRRPKPLPQRGFDHFKKHG